MLRILKITILILLIVILSLRVLTVYFSGRCIIFGGRAAALTTDGWYCEMNEAGIPFYYPLRLLENPPPVIPPGLDKEHLPI